MGPLMLPKVDELGLKILFLLIPGIIALGIVKSIGPRRPSEVDPIGWTGIRVT